MRQRGQTTSNQSGPVAWLGLMFGPYVNPSNTNRKTAFQFWFERYDFREWEHQNLSDKAFCRIWCHFIKKVSGRCYVKKGKKKHPFQEQCFLHCREPFFSTLELRGYFIEEWKTWKHFLLSKMGLYRVSKRLGEAPWALKWLSVTDYKV